jgi:hypothetical protein
VYFPISGQKSHDLALFAVLLFVIGQLMLISPAAYIDEQSLMFNQRLIKTRRLIKDTLELFSGSGDITVRPFTNTS